MRQHEGDFRDQQLRIHKVDRRLFRNQNLRCLVFFDVMVKFTYSELCLGEVIEKPKQNEGRAEKRSSGWLQWLLSFYLSNFFFSVESIRASFPHFRSEGHLHLSTDSQSRESTMHGSQGREDWRRRRRGRSQLLLQMTTVSNLDEQVGWNHLSSLSGLLKSRSSGPNAVALL